MYTATSYGYGEDFVMTPIKCPPPKIVAVKRSLKSKSSSSKTDNGKILDEENDSDVKDDFIDEEEEDAKDLILFEPEEEPLIDLSDNPNSNESRSDDTIKDMNEKNSSTITMLLELLEIGSIINSNNNKVCKRETENVESCAQENDYALLPSSTQRKSSSSSSSFPLESPGACALTDTGNTDKLSSIPSLPQPLTAAIQPENPSIVKNSSDKGGKSVESADKFNKKLGDSVNEPLHIALGRIDQLSIDFKRIQKLKNETAKNLQELQEKEEKSSSIFASSANILTVTKPSSKDSSHSCSKENQNTSRQDKEEKQKANDEHVTLPNSEGVTQNFAQGKKFNSDSNNNNSIECNQNKLNFLSAHTSQRKLPPKFYSSTNSLNRSDCFEASSRLKRLEERFKGFSYTKKLLRSSKVFSKSEEILSSYGIESEFNINGVCGTSETLNSNSSLLDQFPLTTPSTFSENCLRQLIVKSEEECREDKKDYANISSSVQKFSSSSLNSGEFFFLSMCSACTYEADV